MRIVEMGAGPKQNSIISPASGIEELPNALEGLGGSTSDSQWHRRDRLAKSFDFVLLLNGVPQKRGIKRKQPIGLGFEELNNDSCLWTVERVGLAGRVGSGTRIRRLIAVSVSRAGRRCFPSCRETLGG